MKKSIAVIAYDPLAGKTYSEQVKNLFGSRVTVRNYSVMDSSVINLEKCDLYMFSTDALDAIGDASAYLPSDAQRMEIQVTYRKEAIQLLQKIPKGTKVLYVNITEMMAREAVTQLEQLGITHLRFVLYAPGTQVTELTDIAVTPDEERYVPSGIDKVINLGQRTCSSDTMIEAALRLGFDDLLEEVDFKNYCDDVCSNTYYFEQVFGQSKRLESQFEILMETLEHGVIAVNEKGIVYAINKAAMSITGIPRSVCINQEGLKHFSYIPFDISLQEKKETSPEVIRVEGNLISIHVKPVLRHNICIGAFAILQKFNEVEKRQNELRSQLMKKGQSHKAKYCFNDVIGESPAITHTIKILKKMALTESPILLIGETGTGKELFAHSIHNASKRSEQPFVAINCAAMPDNLLESELFGYDEGAFTDAKKGGSPGLFEFAHQGTLFLDEVEGMSPALQVKLLRVLQEHEIMRVGGKEIIHVDARIIAATNEELEQKVMEGTFRQDLYYRLNALPVLIPPLCERGDDVFMIMEATRMRIGGMFKLDSEIKRLFRDYHWPGNVRELYNTVEYFSFTGHTIITKKDLPPIFHLKKENTISSVTEIREENNVDEVVFGAEKIILQILLDANQSGLRIGREKIIKAASKQGFALTQPQVRKILANLSQKGYVSIARGRGGSQITTEGIKWLGL